jgi:hypothetical protein
MPLFSCVMYPSNDQLRPSASGLLLFTETFVLLNGRSYKGERYELVFEWFECKGNGDICQAERTSSLQIPVDTAGEIR